MRQWYSTACVDWSTSYIELNGLYSFNCFNQHSEPNTFCFELSVVLSYLRTLSFLSLWCLLELAGQHRNTICRVFYPYLTLLEIAIQWRIVHRPWLLFNKWTILDTGKIVCLNVCFCWIFSEVLQNLGTYFLCSCFTSFSHCASRAQ